MRRPIPVFFIPGLLAAISLAGCSKDYPDIRASDYDQTCADATDCVIVGVDDVCHPCAGSYLDVIARSGEDDYAADVAAIDCSEYDYSDAPDACPPPPTLRPECQSNQCVAVHTDCGDGLCDFAWDPNETAARCPADCSCGDGICDSTETAAACPDDCGG